MNDRKPNRLPGYDYSQGGYYFVTVCTKCRREWFGAIKNNEMILNEYGIIAKKAWLEISWHFKNIELNEFVIMPDHMHGIIIIKNGYVGNRHACSLQKPQYHTLPVVIGSYKSGVARCVHKMKDGTGFGWQKSFYDHIIRNENSLIQAREYILNDPKQSRIGIKNNDFS